MADSRDTNVQRSCVRCSESRRGRRTGRGSYGGRRGGGIHGPANSYEELAARLHRDGATAVRLEYRRPSYLKEYVYDILAAVDALGCRGIEQLVLVGWSFDGAVVISAGAASGAVVGVATVVSQTYGAKNVGKLSPKKSLLLIHGTADRGLPTISPRSCTPGRVSQKS